MGYARPDVLVETSWVAEHLNDPNVRIVESDEDVLLYEQGHIPGAVKIDWFTELQHPSKRDFLTKEEFERLMSEKGIANDTVVVFYGDKHNWYAAYTFWLFRYFGHDDTKLKIMNGGRKKWLDEKRPLSKEVPNFPKTVYRAKEPDPSIRAFRDEVFASLNRSDRVLIDVRSPKEYTGELIHMPEYPQEGAQRGGHIPGALNIPWAQAVNPDDSTFKPAEELKRALRTLYDHARERGHRLLSHRRAQRPHVVRAHVSVGLSQSQKLRWLVDGVGQLGERADQEGARTVAWTAKPRSNFY
jgi:thiosulfate/3-mercaptopyruvate sulfurtransferase